MTVTWPGVCEDDVGEKTGGTGAIFYRISIHRCRYHPIRTQVSWLSESWSGRENNCVLLEECKKVRIETEAPRREDSPL